MQETHNYIYHGPCGPNTCPFIIVSREERVTEIGQEGLTHWLTLLMPTAAGARLHAGSLEFSPDIPLEPSSASSS